MKKKSDQMKAATRWRLPYVFRCCLLISVQCVKELKQANGRGAIDYGRNISLILESNCTSVPEDLWGKDPAAE